MREIKFRVWLPSEKRMERDMFYINQWDGRCHYTQPHHYEHEDRVVIYDCGEEEPILMQYIEQKDRNGKEIYVGDILENSGWIGQVVYNPPAYKFDDGESFFGIYFRDFKIIGNIYENPELLK